MDPTQQWVEAHVLGSLAGETRRVPLHGPLQTARGHLPPGASATVVRPTEPPDPLVTPGDLETRLQSAVDRFESKFESIFSLINSRLPDPGTQASSLQPGVGVDPGSQARSLPADLELHTGLQASAWAWGPQAPCLLALPRGSEHQVSCFQALPRGSRPQAPGLEALPPGWRPQAPGFQAIPGGSRPQTPDLQALPRGSVSQAFMALRGLALSAMLPCSTPQGGLGHGRLPYPLPRADTVARGAAVSSGDSKLPGHTVL